MTTKDAYLDQRARELRAQSADDVIREPLSRVRCQYGAALSLTLVEWPLDPLLEVGLWTRAGAPAERRERERGRATLALDDLDQLIARLQTARSRLAKKRP